MFVTGHAYITMTLTAVRKLVDVSRFGIDNSLDQFLEILVLRQQLVEVGKLIASIAQPLRPGTELVDGFQIEQSKRIRDILVRCYVSSGYY